MRPRQFFSYLIALPLVAGISSATCPEDPPPPICEVDVEFPGGRWDISDLIGTYTLDGEEVFWPFLDDDKLWDDYDPVQGELVVERLGGSEQNYLDVECDGTVTGMGRERITGNVSKEVFIWYYNETTCFGDPRDMDWTVTLERTYSITGNVTGPGQLDLDFSVDEATIDFSGTLAVSFDCIFIGGSDEFTDFDLSGDVEEVRLSGPLDPVSFAWEPTVTPRGTKTWVDDILHRLALNQTDDGSEDSLVLAPSLDAPGSSQPPKHLYNQYFIQDAVEVTSDLSAMAEPRTPVITAMTLQEPSQYLLDVPVNTELIASIDWRGQPPGQVEFTYGSTVETVPGSDEVTWMFDAGEPGTTIQAKAIAGAEESLLFTINAPKVAVPGWAGTPSDWSGTSGVRYDGSLDWPISLETTQTLDTVSLFTGLWGITGSASSDFQAQAFSNGSSGAGTMTTSANIQFAGKSSNFQMDGPNETTLACDELTTTGEATTVVPVASWKKTLNPLTLIPGLETAVCGLSGLLCNIVRSIGIKGTADATVSGTGTYTGEGAEILWDGGSVGGSLNGQISTGVTLPPPLSAVAGVNVYGGGTGCIEFQVAPSFELTTLGGELEAGASASFLGFSASASETWPFGSGCSGFNGSTANGSPIGWVPADGQLSMAATEIEGLLVGLAVWTETPLGQSRPSGDIRYRFYRNETWGPVHTLTDDADSDLAPSAAFDPEGNALIVYSRSTAPLPLVFADLPDFANGFELEWSLISPLSELPTNQGTLTSNSMHDFGPRLREDSFGQLQLFWQRASGIEITGNLDDPVSIHHSSWDSAAETWADERVVADGLHNTLGWSAAAHDGANMLVGLTLDTDSDLSTAGDREIFEITQLTGVWLAPRQITNNAVADDSPLAGFDPTGAPSLIWRQDEQAWELQGDLFIPPVLAFTSPDPSRDDGIGIEFAHGVMAASAQAGKGYAVLWPEGIELLSSTQDHSGPSPTWPTPNAPISEHGAQTVHWAHQTAHEVIIGYAVQEFEPGNRSLSPWLDPRFMSLPLGDLIFADGFESGDTSSWSATAL